MSSTSQQMKTYVDHLRSEGFEPNFDPEQARARMPEVFSAATMRRFEKLLEIKAERPYSYEELCYVPETLAEAALLLSPAIRMEGSSGLALKMTMDEFLKPGARLAQLGSTVGSWCRWISQEYPDIEVTGIESHPSLYAIAQKTGGADFQHANFLTDDCGQYDVLASLFGDQTRVQPWTPASSELDPQDPMASILAQRFKEAFGPFFQAVTRSLKPEGICVAILRLPLFDAWYAALQTAYAHGLGIDLDRSGLVTAGDEVLPLIVVGRQFVQPKIDELLEWWVEEADQEIDGGSSEDAAALLRYRRLPNKQVAHQEHQQFEDGHHMVTEVGMSADQGYIYEFATTQFRRLQMLSREQLLKIAEAGIKGVDEEEGT